MTENLNPPGRPDPDRGLLGLAGTDHCWPTISSPFRAPGYIRTESPQQKSGEAASAPASGLITLQTPIPPKRQRGSAGVPAVPSSEDLQASGRSSSVLTEDAALIRLLLAQTPVGADRTAGRL